MSAVVINLADHRPPQHSPDKSRKPTTGDMEALAAARFCLGFCSLLNANQRDFINSICKSLPDKSLTERQDDWLAAIVQKIMNHLDKQQREEAR